VIFAVIMLATVASSLAGFALNLPWLLPLLNTLPAYAVLTFTLRRGRRGAAIGWMVWWAFCLALSGVALSIHWHGRAEEVILNGAGYRDEMLSWLATGTGRESSPLQFVPQHLLHAAIFCLLSLITASALSIVMGAALMNYMSFYVGDLILRCAGSPSQTLAIALAWNPWSMVRVVSFIILGVVLAEPLLSRLPGQWPSASGRGRWLLVGAAGLLVDMLLKTILAPLWPGLLRSCIS
jgi:hypothetical protein